MAHFDKIRILLLTGVAGSGKSAIATTIVQLCKERGWLVSAFFFNQSDSTRMSAKEVFPTIARDLADHNPAFREKLWSAVKDSRSLRWTPCLSDQFEHFILNPADGVMMFGPHLVVIDAVDECHNDELQPGSRERFLQVLKDGLSKSSGLSDNFRIFMTS